jgi:hypothetical protein
MGRVGDTIVDDLGRWAGMEFLGRDRRNLVILCAYQVCQKSGKLGQFTAYIQQVALLRMRGYDKPNPRKHFVSDMAKLMKHYYDTKCNVILMGDFNEYVSLDLNKVAHILSEGCLKDTQVYCHGIDSKESTYDRGPTCMDYMFVSSRLLPHIQHQGCEPFNARIFSGHCGIFLDLAYPGIFDRSPNILAPISRCNFQHDCPSHVHKYLLFMEDYIAQHSLSKRATQIQSGPCDNASAKAFDRDVTLEAS